MDLSAFHSQFRDETVENLRALSAGLTALESPALGADERRAQIAVAFPPRDNFTVAQRRRIDVQDDQPGPMIARQRAGQREGVLLRGQIDGAEHRSHC